MGLGANRNGSLVGAATEAKAALPVSGGISLQSKGFSLAALLFSANRRREFVFERVGRSGRILLSGVCQISPDVFLHGMRVSVPGLHEENAGSRRKKLLKRSDCLVLPYQPPAGALLHHTLSTRGHEVKFTVPFSALLPFLIS